jgi:hypothetical protein
LLTDLITEIHEEDRSLSDRDELNGLLTAGKYLELADHCKNRLGGRYAGFLQERLRADTVEIPRPHRVIAQIPFAAIITTNYDKLLERAYEAEQKVWPKTPTNKDPDALGPLLFDGGFFILKAHGDIDRPDTLVLTTADFRELIHANAAFNALFSAVLMTKALLFVGYSLNDPDFRLLLDRQLTTFTGRIPERYAVIPDVGPVEKDVLWRTARIKVMTYSGAHHAELLDFLHALRGAVAAGMAPATPAQSQSSERTAVMEPPRLPITYFRLALSENKLHAQIETDSGAAERVAPPRLFDWPSTRALLHDVELFEREDCKRVGTHLGQLLPQNLLRESTRDNVLKLRLSPELEGFPWELALIDGEPLALRQPVVREPVAVSDAIRGHPQVRRPPKLLLIGDPDRSLPGAREEVREIDALYRQSLGDYCRTLIGPEANYDAVVRELQSGEYDVVHFAGHAWFDAQESYLQLDDPEAVIRASEMRSLLSRRPPAILILNSHYTAFIPFSVRVRDQPVAPRGSGSGTTAPLPPLPGLGGFTEVAAATGVGTFVGCFESPGDPEAKALAVRFHQELLAGIPIAVALHRARRYVWELGDVSATALIYTLSGYADTSLR